MTMTVELHLPPIHGPQPERCRKVIQQAQKLTLEDIKALAMTREAVYSAVGAEAFQKALNDVVWIFHRDGEWDENWSHYQRGIEEAARDAVWTAVEPWLREMDAAMDGADYVRKLRMAGYYNRRLDDIGSAETVATRAAMAALVEHIVPDAARVLAAPWRAVFP